VRQAFLVVHLHELAHQWFGNAVTMPWWDDLWLNEAFATWLSGKLADALEPGYGLALRERESLQWAMQEDGLASARRIAEPIRDYRDVASAFDGITYRKGGAVLTMFQALLGAERFRAGVQRYLRAHAGGNATTDDLLEALAADSVDPAGLAAAFRSFLDQPGVPQVSLALECRDGSAWLAGEQQRFLPLGSGAAPGRVWGLPLCVRSASRAQPLCAVVRAPRFAFPLEGTGCDDWVMPNAAASGYYRFHLAPGARARLDEVLPTLPALEQLAVADALVAGFDSGSLSVAEALEAAEQLAKAPDWPVAAAPLRILRWLREQLAGPKGRAAIDARISRLYGPRLAERGLDEREEESDEIRLERQHLVVLLARARDTALREELVARARGVVHDGSLEARRLAANQRAGVLWVLAQEGSDAEFDAIVSALEEERDAQLRGELLRALGAATAPARAARARALALDPAVQPGEILALLGSHFDREANRDQGRAWLLAHQETLFERLPSLHAANLPAYFAEGACSEAEAREVEARFRERVAGLEGGPRALAKLTERIRLCAALREHHQARGFEDAFAEPKPAVSG
jgi:alanyl aminopeptidase